MKWFSFFSLILTCTILQGTPITEHLNVNCEHTSPSGIDIDAAFVIRLQDHKDISPLLNEFEKKGIPLVEYNKFNTLHMETMTEFCSNIVSPYLLTQILSHLSIYKYCLANGLDRVLILEDSATLVEDPRRLNQSLKDLSDRKIPWDIFYTDIDFHDGKTGEFIVPRIAEVPRNKQRMNKNLSKILCRYGTASFVISKTGMEKILMHFEKKRDNLPYDQILFKIPDLNIYGSNFDIITNEYKLGTREESSQVKSTKPNQNWKIGDEFWIPPSQLLNFDRFDIMPKYIFAKYSINNYNTCWHLDLYRSHLEKWVKCYNTKPLKIGFDDFLNSFNSLIQNIRTEGFDERYAIGIDNQNVPWNGAHRIGTCLALDIPIKVKTTEKRPSQELTAKVFHETYHLEEKYLDHMAFEYAKLNDKTFIACLYPIGHEYRDKAEEVLQKYGSIIHQKDIWLTQSGAMEFIRLVYTGEWWTGSYLDDSKHSRGKVLLTFPEKLRTKYPVRVFLYECDSKEVATKAKEELREFCQKGNEIIHINDTHEQTKLISATLFNQNSIDFINKRNLNRCENFDHLFSEFKKFIIEHDLNQEHLCIDTSAVLSAWGLRDCVDLDVLHRDPLPSSYKENKIDSHNRYLHLHALDLDEILFNPENHFYYDGIKFITPDLIKQMKAKRGSEKDLRDIELINASL